MICEKEGGFEVSVVKDSLNEEGFAPIRLTTLQLRYPRFIHSEFMTHRMFSRNASSSRAIPNLKMLKQVRDDPASPVHWGQNIPGMQAKDQLPPEQKKQVQAEWKVAGHYAADASEYMSHLGAHKQIANRVLEPFQWMSVVVTATEWENWFTLRRHEAAQPEIHFLADMMYAAMNKSIPNLLKPGQWHMPYLQTTDIQYDVKTCLKLSTARCARVSYLNHDKSEPDFDKDIALWKTLYNAGHFSPFEHQATPMEIPQWNPRDVDLEANLEGITHYDTKGNAWSGNFRGWIQQRHCMDCVK